MRLTFFSILLASAFILHAQPRKAIRAFEQAQISFGQGNMEQGEQLLKDALKIDPNYIEARMMLADHLYRSERYEEAAPHYESLAMELPDDQVLLYRLGYCLYWSGEFALAEETLRLYLDHPEASPKLRAGVQRTAASCAFALESLKEPIEYSIVNMGDSINTRWMEYFPAITADGAHFFFTRNQARGRKYQEDFYQSDLLGDDWSKAFALPGNLNSDDNEGAMSISSDGQVLFFTACQRADGQGSCDLYISMRKGGVWGSPFPLPDNVNSSSWESQPSISFDGQRLYFSSNRDGGFGGKDIWYTDYLGSGQWSDPVNAGELINTTLDETTPFIHWDNEHLYFASEGHPGIGGLDLFVVEWHQDHWSEPLHLGYPLNTQKDESGLIVSPDGGTAYVASDGLADSKGMIDLYSLRLPEEARAYPVAYMEGKVIDKETGKAVPSLLKLMDLSTGKVHQLSPTDKEGNYYLCLPVGRPFSLQVSEEGYLFYSEHFELEESDRTVARQKDIPLSKISSGKVLALHNVFFDHDKSSLRPESKFELDLLVDLLKINPDLSFEVGGHTDNTGSEERNMELSYSRARSVSLYLEKAGVDPDRMSVRAYGSSEPVDTNDTEAGRQHNRRTEIKFE
jgi:outer membrane protein OmpA-like peptidoglycan-associated protein